MLYTFSCTLQCTIHRHQSLFFTKFACSLRNTALPLSVSCTILYTAVSTLHSRTMSIMFITARSTLYNNWSVQWKYDLEKSIPQIINPLHQQLRCLCTEQCTMQCTVYFAVYSGNMSPTPAKWTHRVFLLTVPPLNFLSTKSRHILWHLENFQSS